jgi:hypothetical protein
MLGLGIDCDGLFHRHVREFMDFGQLFENAPQLRLFGRIQAAEEAGIVAIGSAKSLGTRTSSTRYR